MYAVALRNTILTGENVTNGLNIVKHFQDLSFRGMSGRVRIDKNGNRHSNFIITQLNPQNGLFETFAEIKSTAEDVRVYFVQPGVFPLCLRVTHILKYPFLGQVLQLFALKQEYVQMTLRVGNLMLMDLPLGHLRLIDLPLGHLRLMDLPLGYLRLMDLALDHLRLMDLVFRPNIRPTIWPSGKIGNENAPPDSPACGFDDELCSSNTVETWAVTVISLSICTVITLTVIGGIAIYRCQAYEVSVQNVQWKLSPDDLSNGTTEADGSGNQDKENRSKSCESGLQRERVFTDVATYRGLIVSLKHIKKENLQLTREIRIGFTEARGHIPRTIHVNVP
ncbi:hypothetical protein LSAT2_014234, partial [Lamellibrachia satsuma]